MRISKLDKNSAFVAVILLILTLIVFNQVIIHPTWLISPSYDMISAYTPWKFSLNKYYNEFKEIPLWYPKIFSGTPFLGNLSVAMFYYPFNLLFQILPSEMVYGYIMLSHVFLAGISMYFLMRFKNISRFSSMIAGISYMFSGVLMAKIFVGSMTEMLVISWVPAVFLFFEIVCEKKRLIYAVLLGIVLALQFHASMIRNFFYSSFALVIYFLYSILKKNPRSIIKISSFCFVALITCIALSAIHLFPGFEVANYATRNVYSTYEFSTIGSFEPEKVITFVLPNFFGTIVNNTEWRQGWWEKSAYFGVAALIFSIIGLLFNRQKSNIGYIFVALFGFLHGLGKYTPFFGLLYNYIPGFKLFRVPGATIFLVTFSMVVFTAYGIDYIIKANKRKQGLVWKFLLIIGILVLLTIPVLESQRTFVINKGKNMLLASHIVKSPDAKPISYYDRKITKIFNGIVADVAKAGLIALSLGFVLLLKTKSKLKLSGLRIFILLIVVIDMMIFAMPMIWVKDPSEIFIKTDISNFFETDKTRFRVFDTALLLPHKFAARDNIELVTGYDPMMLHYYIELANLISGHQNASATELPLSADRNFTINSIENYRILDILNAKYIISDIETNSTFLKLVYKNLSYTYPERYGGKEYINVTGELYIYENLEVLPRAYIVRDAKIITDKEKLLFELNSEDYNPREYIILEEHHNVNLENDGEFRQVDIKYYSPNKIIIETRMENPGFLVLSEIWYPAWKAFDNGVQIEVFKTNHALRSVYLDEGKHTVEFLYKPVWFKIGKIITLVTILLITVFFFVNGIQSRRILGN